MMRYQGKVIGWNDAKGFGFVEPNGGGDRAFVHISEFSRRTDRPVDGEIITYALERDSRNRLRAVRIRPPKQAKAATRRSRPAKRKSPVVVIVSFTVIVATLTALGKVPFFVPVAYLIASGITFLAYGIDKSAAMNRRWRTPENTLHLLSLAGGWPGALAAQHLFRHKSSKPEFRSIFWFTVVLNCGALAWLATGLDTSFLMAHTISLKIAIA